MGEEVVGEEVRSRPNRRTAAEGLIRTAERLFAVHGLEGVSLRQIAVEAGHRNPGAVQYHFGTKEGLVQAIVNYRLPWVNQRRNQLLQTLDAQLRPHDLRGLVEVLARPYLEMDPEAYYVHLIARLSPLEGLLRSMYESAGEYASGSLSLADRLDAALRSLPPLVRRNRLSMARYLMHNAIAARRTLASSGMPLAMSDDLFAQELYEALYAVLTAQHHVPWPDRPHPLDLMDDL